MICYITKNPYIRNSNFEYKCVAHKNIAIHIMSYEDTKRLLMLSTFSSMKIEN